MGFRLRHHCVERVIDHHAVIGHFVISGGFAATPSDRAKRPQCGVSSLSTPIVRAMSALPPITDVGLHIQSQHLAVALLSARPQIISQEPWQSAPDRDRSCISGVALRLIRDAGFGIPSATKAPTLPVSIHDTRLWSGTCRKFILPTAEPCIAFATDESRSDQRRMLLSN